MLLRTLFILFLFSSPAWAMRAPLMMTAVPSTSATNYAGFASSFVATSDTSVRNVAPVPGIFEGMIVTTANAAPGGSASYTVTLEKNGADTGVSCVISASSQTCSSTEQFSVVAGDTFSIKSVPASTPVAVNLAVSTVFNSGTGVGQLIVSSANAVSPSTSATQTSGIMGNQSWPQTAFNNEMPTNGAFSNLYVKASAAPGTAASGKAYITTIITGGVASTLTCQTLETATTCNDATHSVAVITGNTVQISSAPTSTPATAFFAISMIFTPTIDGENIYTLGTAANSPSNTSQRFFTLTSQAGIGYNQATEANVQFVVPMSLTARKLRTRTSLAPGSGKSWTYDLRSNAAITTVTCSSSGTSTTICSDLTHNAILSTGDLINFSNTPSGTPTASVNNFYEVVLYADPNDKVYGGTLYGATIY